jgi:hypothetical protein
LDSISEDSCPDWIKIAQKHHGEHPHLLRLWRSWKTLSRIISDTNIYRGEELQQKINQFSTIAQTFGQDIIHRWSDEAISSPYFHIVIQHSTSMLNLHGSIGYFGQQGFEAAHQWHRRLWWSATCRNGGNGGTTVILQMLTRIYRTQCLQLFLAENNEPFYLSDIFDK